MYWDWHYGRQCIEARSGRADPSARSAEKFSFTFIIQSSGLALAYDLCALHALLTSRLSLSDQEHIETAKPAREHVTTIDGEIQTWLPILILVTSKYGKAATAHA